MGSGLIPVEQTDELKKNVSFQGTEKAVVSNEVVKDIPKLDIKLNFTVDTLNKQEPLNTKPLEDGLKLLQEDLKLEMAECGFSGKESTLKVI